MPAVTGLIKTFFVNDIAKRKAILTCRDSSASILQGSKSTVAGRGLVTFLSREKEMPHSNKNRSARYALLKVTNLSWSKLQICATQCDKIRIAQELRSLWRNHGDCNPVGSQCRFFHIFDFKSDTVMKDNSARRANFGIA